MAIRGFRNYDPDNASLLSGLCCSEDSLITQQHFKDQCDINRIVAQYEQTGVVSARNAVPLDGSEFVSVMDFHQAMNIVREGEEAFSRLPATIRERFKNEPMRFVEFIGDPANREEAQRLNLVQTGASGSSKEGDYMGSSPPPPPPESPSKGDSGAFGTGST